MNERKIKLIITATLAILIAWQSYQIYQIEKKLSEVEKSGQLKCSKPDKR